MLSLTMDPIDPSVVVAAVKTPADGAVVSFIGVVRNHSHGRVVLGLEYEAYEPMALEQLKVIAGEIAERWPLTHTAVRHRVGRLVPGDIAVVIAVGSAHRAEAFDACEYAIDRIKEIVPIWKREVYPDGAEWKLGA